MLRKNKWKIFVSSLAILLPVLFGVIMWNDLPDVMTTHWGVNGKADGFSGKTFAVFGVPVILLGLHFICLLVTTLDKKQKEQNQKALGMIFWIVPLISVFLNGIMYRAAFGKAFNVEFFVPALCGVMFLFIGNYLPKIKQNRTLGIKLSWTLRNEENWNKTHRLTGKVWVAGGLIMLLTAFLPFKVALWIMICVFAAMVIVPVAYSYSVYKQHQKEGIAYTAAPRSRSEKLAVRITAIMMPVILVGIGVLMFTGDIEVRCEETTFAIHATYWTDLNVAYSEIDTVECRKELNLGMRTNGFASAKLSMGIFKNDEFGLYTLYAYTGAQEYIVLTSETKTLVIGLRNSEDAQGIYHTILEKIQG